MPVHVPWASVSTCPLLAVPEIVGATVLTGEPAAPATTPVGEESALLAPAEFVAVTLTRSVEPESAAWTAYVCAVAPLIVAQLAPLELQRCHW